MLAGRQEETVGGVCGVLESGLVRERLGVAQKLRSEPWYAPPNTTHHRF